MRMPAKKRSKHIVAWSVVLNWGFEGDLRINHIRESDIGTSSRCLEHHGWIDLLPWHLHTANSADAQQGQ